MFPSQGYFCTTNCPDFVSGKCNRVYCHFYHNEKLQKYNQNKNHSSNLNNVNSDNFTLEKQLPHERFEKLGKNDESNQISRSNTDILQDKTHNVSAQSVYTSEASTSNTSNKATSDILTHIIGEAVKKVLCENSTLNSITLDPNDFIKSLDASIVTKAAQEISTVHLQNTSGKKQHKLYLPPPGTPSYKPTPISELNNKYSKQKDTKINFEAVEEYTPTPISCRDKDEDEDEEITDFSSDEDNDSHAKSDFDMLEEVLVEKLSSDPARNKAIQKRKKALRKLSTHISSKPSQNVSKNIQEKPLIESLVPQAVFSDSLSNSDSAFDPPSPIFTSSADTSVSYSVDQNPAKSANDSSMDSPVSSDVSNLPELKNSEVITDEVGKVSISSTHNLLPQIAELARPNVKSWTPVAKVDSILSVEKMLEQLDRIENVDKNPSQKNTLNRNLLDTKTTQNASETEKLINSKEKESNLDNSSFKQKEKEVVSSKTDELNKSSKADELNLESINAQNSSRDSCSSQRNKKKNSTDEKTIISGDETLQDRRSRKRSLNSDNSSSDNKCKRKRSSSSSKRKKRHKHRYSSMDESSVSEDFSDSRRGSSEDRHAKKRKKHKKHKGRKAKDHRKRSKRDRSRSHKKRRSREKRYHSDSSESTESNDSDSKQHSESKGYSKDKNSTLLAPHQIKQEKIEVDLSIVKIEKAEDNIPNKDRELKKTKISPSENKETDKLSSSAPSGVKVVSQDKSKSEFISKPIKLIKDNVLKNSVGNKKIINSQSPKSGAENSVPKENVTKSASDEILNVSKNVQSSNDSHQTMINSNDFNVQTENSAQKSDKTISSRKKLDNYTSSLLAKVSDSGFEILRPRTNSSESSKSTSEKQDIINSSSNSSETNQKDLKHTQNITSNKKDSSDTISSPKSKCLKEFSIFDGLKEISSSKRPSRLSSNSKRSSKKPDDKNLSEKLSRERTLPSSHGSEIGRSKSKEKERSKSKEEKERSKEKEGNKIIEEKERSKIKEKEKEGIKSKEKERSKSKENEKERSKSKENEIERSKKKENERIKSKEKEKERSKSNEKEKERSKRSSSTKGSSSHSSQKEKDRHQSRESSSKSAKDKDNKGKSSSHSSTKHRESSSYSRSKDFKDSKRPGNNRSRKDSSSESRRKNVAEKSTKPNFNSSDASPAGSDSSIPDLSVLDDIPKEDWDQLLSSSHEKIDSSDSDEGIDISQNYPVEEDFNEENEDEEEDINDPRVLEECMKVFSEYDPSENVVSTVAKKEPLKDGIVTEDIVVPTKKNRVAFSGAAGNLIAKPKPLVKPHRKTPGEIMLDRYKKLKEEEVQLQKKLEMQRKELAKHGRLPPSGLAISSSSVSSTSDLSPASHTATAVSSSSGKKRIAIAPKNVSALLKSKELLKAKPTNSSNKILVSTTSAAPKATPAMSQSKGAKRIAHIPNLETIERPVISIEDGTKVPQNIRQRYLNCFIDETLKFCDGDSHACNVALAEETICHKRATTRMVYLNLAVNILKKLRACQISEAAQELLLNDPKYKDTRESRIVSQPIVSSSSPSSSSSASKKKSIHPVNPNHRVVSHYSVITSGGQKGTWSIEKSKKSLPDNINDYLKGVKFYKCLKKYILNTEQLEENCFPRPDPSVKGKAILKKINSRKKISPNESERFCDRCSVLYKVDKWGLPISNAPCVYHWGRAYKSRGIGGLEAKYSCCHGDSQSEGCCLGTTHVSENFSPDSLTSYVRTIPKSPDNDGDFGIYALDCEMCYTTAGSELTRVTVVDTNCNSVYETLVKPENPIIDYNTRFSGITEENMEGVTVRLRDVQAALLTRFSEKTILMGHSLESDFAALKIIHDTVVDTSVVFPHKLGPPFKRALRNLASEYLSKIIQNDDGGHDSAEDANTCMQLMKWKIKEDLKGQF